MQYVYRIEDEDGCGVYGVVGYHNTHEHALDKHRHPLPADISFRDNYDFGFATIKDFCHWFDKGDRHNLRNMNLSYIKDNESHRIVAVSVYEVDEDNILHGKRQCTFNRFKSRLAFRIELLTDEARALLKSAHDEKKTALR